MTSRLLSYSNLTGYVTYEYCDIVEDDTGKSYKGCCSKDFLKSGESLITLDRVLIGVTNKNFYQLCQGKNSEESIKLIVDIIENNLHVQDFGTWLSTLLKLDRIILNEDRHEHNIAFIRNNEGFGVSPIFDNGASFLSDTTFDYKLGTRTYVYMSKVKAKPFVSDFSKQVNSSDAYRHSNFKIDINEDELPKLYADLPYSEITLVPVTKVIVEVLRAHLLSIIMARGDCMGRNSRIEEMGMIYHVIQRGNNKEYVFRDENDKGFLIQQLKKYKQRLGYNVYGFVIMDNHYHFILQTFDIELQNVMHRINSKYSKYYNFCHEHSGHVFQGRYKAILVQDEKYLLGLLSYIHQNPVRANRTSEIFEYKWSSDIFYRSNIDNAVVDIELILTMFSENREQAILEYKNFMDIEDKASIGLLQDNTCVGGQAYIKMTKSMGQKTNKKDLTQILLETGINEEQFDCIKKASRKRSLTRYKVEYIREALEIGYTLKEIGDNIGMNAVSVRELLNRYELKQY